MLDGLEAADRPAELLPDLGVGHGHVERALRAAELLGRDRDGRHVERVIEHGPGRTRLADQPGWRVVERQPGQFPGLVQRGQRPASEPVCWAGDAEQG